MTVRREREREALRPSLLDRLLAPVLPEQRARGQLEAVAVRELCVSLVRDLEWLLNTKRALPDSLESFPEASESILTYGLPDLSNYSWRNPGDVTAIARVLEEVIRRFEPRLRARTVVVTPLPGDVPSESRLRFRIDAVLHVEPIHAPVSFDTDVDWRASAVTVRNPL